MTGQILVATCQFSDYTPWPDLTETAVQDAIPTESYGSFGLIKAIERVLETLSEPARNEPVLAAQFLADAERVADSITDASLKAQALSGIAQALAATDPDRAARLFDDAERIANSITDAPSKVSALIGVARALTASLS